MFTTVYSTFDGFVDSVCLMGSMMSNLNNSKQGQKNHVMLMKIVDWEGSKFVTNRG